MGPLVPSEFLFRPTQVSDVEDLALLGAKVTLTDCTDPEQLLFTGLSKNGVSIAFLRFRVTTSHVLWADFVFNPNYLKTDFKIAVLGLVQHSAAHFKRDSVMTVSGLIVGAWKSFVKQQAVRLGYRVEDVKPDTSKSLVLRF